MTNPFRKFKSFWQIAIAGILEKCEVYQSISILVDAYGSIVVAKQ